VCLLFWHCCSIVFWVSIFCCLVLPIAVLCYISAPLFHTLVLGYLHSLFPLCCYILLWLFFCIPIIFLPYVFYRAIFSLYSLWYCLIMYSLNYRIRYHVVFRSHCHSIFFSSHSPTVFNPAISFSSLYFSFSYCFCLYLSLYSQLFFLSAAIFYFCLLWLFLYIFGYILSWFMLSCSMLILATAFTFAHILFCLF
jgi:hypothetical protein